MTEQAFNKKLKKAIKVEAKIQKLQEDNLDLDMEIYGYLIKKLKTKEEFEAWLKDNQLPGFIKLLVLNHLRVNEK